MTIPSIRGNQETNLLELDYLPLWLTGIKANQCREEIRPYLKEFKLKAKDVLAAAFLDNKPKQLSLPKPKEHKIIKKYYNGVPVMSVKIILDFLNFNVIIRMYRRCLGWNSKRSLKQFNSQCV